MKQLIILLAILSLSISLYGQTADVTEGCAPLTVQFTAPDAASYFWDFDDSASSIEKEPENVYTTAGTYEAKLYTSQGGSLIGTINITVYPEIVVNIDNDNDFGCIPLEVGFTSQITSDPAVDIQNINWTFGDGNTGTGNAPMTTYQRGGIFDISVEIETNFIQCNKTVIFEDVIEAENLIGNFVFPNDIPCTEPATFVVNTDLEEDPRYSYSWDFGSGSSSSSPNSYDPGEVTFNSFGEYDISLIVSSPSGCTDTTTQTIIIGPPEVTLDFPPKVCLGEEFQIKATTLGVLFDWRYGDPLTRILNEDEITVKFDEPGFHEITFITAIIPDCKTTTTISVEVESLDPTFSLEPEFSCSELDPQTLIANDPNLASYVWNEEPGGNTLVIPGLDSPRDPLYINRLDSFSVSLEVTSDLGCKADTTLSFAKQLAEAYYIPDMVIGLNSLDVTFSDLSESQFDIVRRYWIYDDGTTQELDPTITEHTHTYECGTYYPRLVIEDAFGCIDTSKAVEIRVICPGEPDTTGTIGLPIAGTGDGDGTGGFSETICVNDEETLVFPVTGYQYHLYTDDCRLSHCWEELVFDHEFNFPGTYPTSLLVEYEGIIAAQFEVEDIVILGARSEILYEKNCGSNSVNFQSISLNGDALEWTYNGEVISTDESFSYNFTEPGEHDIFLTATSETGGCDPDVDMVTVYIPELKADFVAPTERICNSEPYILDATASVDVHSSCHKGYKWIFENQRPRETGEATLEHRFERGEQDVTLVVEDINGCTDTLTQTITIFGVDAQFNMDSNICLPYDKDFEDLSISDTTLVSWVWSFGSNEQNPNHVFDETDINPEKQDTISIQFIATDLLGCTDTLDHDMRVVDPNFSINSQSGSRVCLGEQAVFSVIDTADIKDDYNFYWEIDGVRQDSGLLLVLTFDTSGTKVITLISQHKNGDCTRSVERDITVLDAPVAGFTSDVDDIDIICYPAQISFTSDPSLSSSEYDFEWRFGDDDFSEIANPTIEFGIGTHVVTQIISNSDGCKDSISMVYTLVGPEGTFTQDKDIICLGDEVTFTLGNTANISSYIWNFGDGTEVENVNPVTHSYDFRPEGDATVVTLTLKSDDTGCDATVEAPLALANVIADIEDLGQICRGELRVNNNSVGATSVNWDFGDGTSSTDIIPIKVYEDAGSYDVILTVSDGICEATDTITIMVDEDAGIGLEMPNLFTPNSDSQNDIFGPVVINAAEEEVTIRTFKIYNRYGELVYDNQSPDGWNGIYNADTAPPEVYAYFIEIDIAGCSTISRKGSVTLMR